MLPQSTLYDLQAWDWSHVVLMAPVWEIAVVTIYRLLFGSRKVSRPNRGYTGQYHKRRWAGIAWLLVTFCTQGSCVRFP